MGNVLPACLVQHGGATAAAAALSPGMKPRQRLVSLKLLVKAVNKMKTKRPGSNGNKQAKIGSKSSSSTAAADEKGGEVGRKINYSNPKGSVLRSRLHHGGHNKKGVVRVKVVLTKEEAARLLTLTVGGQKTAEQIVAEIKRMELRRAANTWRPALESIPEESS
jgi:hypothetical protein